MIYELRFQKGSFPFFSSLSLSLYIVRKRKEGRKHQNQIFTPFLFLRLCINLPILFLFLVFVSLQSPNPNANATLRYNKVKKLLLSRSDLPISISYSEFFISPYLIFSCLSQLYLTLLALTFLRISRRLFPFLLFSLLRPKIYLSSDWNYTPKKKNNNNNWWFFLFLSYLYYFLIGPVRNICRNLEIYYSSS